MLRYAVLLAFASAANAEDIFASKLQVEFTHGVGGEGPAWLPKAGVLSSGNGHTNLYFPQEGKAIIHRKDSGTNGLLVDAKGRLIACEPGQRRVTRTDRDGELTVLADSFESKKFNTPNDLTVDSKGRIYFSDPRYGDRASMEMKVEGVYRIDLDGKVARVLGAEVERANGVLVSADDKFLFVADNNNDTVGGARKLYRFNLNEDGTVDGKSRKLLHDWKDGRGPDGLKQDVKGRLYVAAGSNKPNKFEPSKDILGGIYVLDADGKFLYILNVPTDEVTNCAFGHDDGKTLFITAGGTLYSVRTTTAGHTVFPLRDAK